MATRNYYEILGVPATASHSEVYDAYLQLATAANPESFDYTSQRELWDAANETRRSLNEAYTVLGDPDQRAEYDTLMASTVPSASAFREAEYQPRVPEMPADPVEPVSKAVQEPPAFMGATSVRFVELPASDQEMLRTYLNDKAANGTTRIPTRTLLVPGLFALASLGWLFMVMCLADDKKWDDTLVPMYLAGTMFGVVAFWLSCVAVVNWRKAPIRPFAMFTPLYYISTTLDLVKYWPMGALQAFNATHHYYNGIYTNTSVRIKFAGTTQTLTLRSKKAYESMVEALGRWQDEVIAAAGAGDDSYMRSRNIFSGFESSVLRGAASREAKSPPAIMAFIRVLVLGCIAGALWFGCAYKLNDYFDDGIAWNQARVMNTASSYRTYLQYRPKGRFRTDANAQISQLYGDAGKHYQDIRSGLYDKSASDAVLNILNYAKSTGRYQVRVAFERDNLIPKGVEKQYANAMNVHKVIPIGDAFSDQHMTAREDDIVSSISSAFATVMAKDILSFERSGFDDSDIIFAVKYAVVPGQSLYYREKDESLSSSKRPYYPGISFVWDFEIRVPNSKSAPYRFQLDSNPAAHISYETHSEGAEASEETGSVYDAMAHSAFDNFRGAIVRHFGLGQSAKSGKQSGSNAENDRLNKELQEVSQQVETGTEDLKAKGLALDAALKNLNEEDNQIASELKRVGRKKADPSDPKVKKYNADRSNYNKMALQFNEQDKKIAKQAARVKELQKALGIDDGN